MKIDDPRESTLFKIMDFTKSVVNRANKIGEKEGFMIPVDQIPVVMIVYYSGEGSQQYIADCLHRDKSSILRSIASLSVKGYIVTEIDVVDKRKKSVKLTSEGVKIAKQVEQRLASLDESIFAVLEDKEKTILNKLLDKCIHGIKNSECN